jgi:hypothetical protein
MLHHRFKLCRDVEQTQVPGGGGSGYAWVAVYRAGWGGGQAEKGVGAGVTAGNSEIYL